ncbi:MAG: hypothetical protein HUJ97_07575 [Bacteroidales bacterium]|nr:hypothetical protein [Bacteroidales bacterium]
MKNIFTNISYILVIVAAITYMPFPDYAPYIMLVGAVGLFVSHFMERYIGRNMRLRHIIFIRHIIGFLYGIVAYLIFQRGMYWVLALLIAAILEIYTLWVIDKESKK